MAVDAPPVRWHDTSVCFRSSTLFSLVLGTLAANLLQPEASARTYVGSAYEPFDYFPSLVLEGRNGGTGFNSTGSGPINPSSSWGNTYNAPKGWGSTSIASGSLNGSIPSAGNHAVFTGAGYNPGMIGRSLGQTVDEGSLYFSYYTERLNDSTRSINFALFEGSTEKFAFGQFGTYGVNTNGDFAIAFENNITTLRLSDNPINYATGKTHLVIGRIDFNASGVNDRIRLYLNPTQLDDESLITPYLDLSEFDIGAINAFRPFAGAEMEDLPNASAAFDEIRFGSTFSAVTIPEPSVAACLAVGLLSLIRRYRYPVSGVGLASDSRITGQS